MNQMGMVADAERLPWLTDDRPKRSRRGPSLIALGLVTAMLVAGASSLKIIHNYLAHGWNSRAASGR